jgi:hypothetical protein
MEDQNMNQPLNQNAAPNEHRYLPVLIVVLLILLMGVFGWWYLKDQPSSPSTADTTSKAVPEVNTANDLNTAGSFLSDSQIDNDLDTSEIDEVLSN